MKALTFVYIFCVNTILHGQDYPLYRMYTYDQFINEHFTDSISFIRSFSAVYPAVARENRLEGKIDLYLINHSDSSFEIRILNRYEKLFYNSVYEAISHTRHVWLNKDIPFIANFCIQYELEIRGKPESQNPDDCVLVVKGYGPGTWRDSSSILIAGEVAYKPQISVYPQFLRFSRLKKYPLIQSLEDLFEEAIFSCCRKRLKLRQQDYSSGEDYMRVTFHSKGHITKIELFGKLADSIDVKALEQMLKAVYFQPALSYKLVPVHVALGFGVVK